MKKQMIFQKVVCLMALITSVAFFVFGLGFSTDIYDLYKYTGEMNAFYVKGSEIYYEVQDFNRLEVKLAVAFILIAVLLFVTKNNTRRKYYISNFISSLAYCIFAVYISIFVEKNAMAYKEQFLTTVDFEKWKFWYDMFMGKLPYNDSTFWFDAGKWVAAFGIISVVLVVANVVWKVVWMNLEKKAMAINEIK